MIKKIKIKNFESHKNTTYDLTSGFNLFRGDNDSGKSSGFRAVSVVAYNLWDENMVRLGAKSSEIFIETDKGSVSVIRGGGKNEWVVYEIVDGEKKKYEYSKIGRTVPDVATRVLGMPKLQYGNVNDVPNMLFQLDKHYMMSEIDGKKCTPNMVAQMVDEILGLRGAEMLIYNMSSDHKKIRMDLNSCDEKIELERQKLHDEDDIKSKRDKINYLRGILKRYKKNERIVERYSELNNRIQTCLSSLENINKKLESLKNIDDIIENYKEIVNNYDKLKNFQTLLNNFTVFNKKLDFIDLRLSKYKNLLVCSSFIDGLNEKNEKLNDYCRIFNAYDRMKKEKNIVDEKLSKIVDLEKAQGIYDKLFSENERLKSLLIIFGNRSDIIKRISVINNNLCESSKSLSFYEEKKKDFIMENPNCPTCGQTLKEKFLCQ